MNAARSLPSGLGCPGRKPARADALRDRIEELNVKLADAQAELVAAAHEAANALRQAEAERRAFPLQQTSLSHPLTIDAVAVPSGGRIGMTFCPGKKYPEPWDRDLDVDLECIRDWGTAAVVTFMEGHELSRCEVAEIGSAVLARGMRWFHLPIVGASIPDNVFEARWADVGPVLRSCLGPGGAIVLHCRGGLGRTGTIAGRLLVELGAPSQCAVAQIRLVRPGTIETIEQEAYVLRMRPVKAIA